MMEKESKPSNVTSEDWSKMDKKKKWMVMHQATETLPEGSRFLECARAIIDDAERFSESMTHIFKLLRRRIRGFVEIGAIFPDPFMNNLENKLCECLLQNLFN